MPPATVAAPAPPAVLQVAGNSGPLAGPSLGPALAPGWSPTAVANALRFPVQSGYDGSGTTIAIIADSAPDPGDLAAYFAYEHTPQTGRTIATVAVDGASTVPGGNGDRGDEAALDVETVAGLAPGANVLVYVVPSLTGSATLDALERILSDGRANVVTYSASGCEPSAAFLHGATAIFAAAAAAHVAFVAASGDRGNQCFAGTAGGANVYAVGAGWPASDPNAIAVGGTQTGVSGVTTSLTSTTSWNDTFTIGGLQEASGGGVSSAFALPAYQSGLRGAASAAFRNVPDVAMPAALDAVFANGAWELVDGTSWAAPQFAALLAEVDEYCTVPVAAPTQALYAVAAASATAFIDVTGGSNQYGGSAPFYTAGPGYDNTSGLGVPYGMPFAQALCPNRLPGARARIPAAATRSTALPADAADVVPRLRGLADRGRRDAAAPTMVQLVLTGDAAAESTVTAELRSAGFTISQTFANHLVIDAQGSAAAVEALFGTALHDVGQDGFGVRYAPAAAARIPARLQPFVAGLCLDNVVALTARR